MKLAKIKAPKPAQIARRAREEKDIAGAVVEDANQRQGSHRDFCGADEVGAQQNCDHACDEKVVITIGAHGLHSARITAANKPTLLSAK